MTSLLDTLEPRRIKTAEPSVVHRTLDDEPVSQNRKAVLARMARAKETAQETRDRNRRNKLREQIKALREQRDTIEAKIAILDGELQGLK